MVKLRYEVWMADGTITLCRAGPDGDQARKLLEPGARLAHTFEAGSEYEASSLYYAFMGWGEYKPEPSWGNAPYEPFTAEQLRRQESAR
jgi:hypothetical protein